MAVGILGLLKARPGRGEELGKFLADGRDLAAAEGGTVTWHAFKVDPETYGVFDTFEDEAGRQAHLNGELASASARSPRSCWRRSPRSASSRSSPPNSGGAALWPRDQLSC